MAAERKVIPFARAVAKESSLAKKLRNINSANAEFWSKPGPNIVQAGLAFAQLKKSQQKARAKKPRPQRKEKHADRDQRIRNASVTDKKTPKQIAADEGLTASQVRRILKATTKTRV